MTEHNWTWHPITRVVAALLAIFLTAGAGIAIVFAVRSVARGELRYGMFGLVALLALWLVRPLVIGAWTGEEPPVHFDEDEHPGAAG